ncbi:hypothetical protein EW146_g5081, partial [Bondarzewia mesenterica]
NPNATLPALAADGKTYDSTIDVIDFLVNYSTVKVPRRTSITQQIHDDSIDPNFALLAVRDEAERAVKVAGFPKYFIENRDVGIRKYSSTPEAAPYKSLYDAKLGGSTALLALYNGTAPADFKSSFFAKSQANWNGNKAYIYTTLPSLLSASSGPFLAGASPGEDDFHVAAWFTHIAMLLGAKGSADGLGVLEKGFGKPVPEKVSAYWNAWSGRASWKKVYVDNGRQLH